MQIRFDRSPDASYGQHRTLYKPQWRKRDRDPWHDEFISAFDNLADAKLWARREYGPDVEFCE